MEITLRDITSGKNDVRKFMSIGMSDEILEWQAGERNISVDVINELLEAASIYVDGDKFNFPSNLQLSHDRAVEQLNALKREIVRKEYEERKEALKYAEIEVDNFAFIVPKTASELIDEGKALKHCVGGSSYINDHADGKTTIVFVRRKDSVEQPFYTIEFNNWKIKQLRGFKNQKPTQDVKTACDKWLQVVTSKFS